MTLDYRTNTRPLNERGKRDAPKMGKRLAKRDVEVDLILSSPAKRAIETARVFADKLDYKGRISLPMIACTPVPWTIC